MCILNLLNLTNITKNLDGLLLILIVFFFLNLCIYKLRITDILL